MSIEDDLISDLKAVLKLATNALECTERPVPIEIADELRVVVTSTIIYLEGG